MCKFVYKLSEKMAILDLFKEWQPLEGQEVRREEGGVHQAAQESTEGLAAGPPQSLLRQIAAQTRGSRQCYYSAEEGIRFLIFLVYTR